MGQGSSVLADKYDEEEFQRLNQRFKEAAAEGSFRGKTIDKKTFIKFFFAKKDKEMGSRFFDIFDSSRNGKMDWEEFATGVFICTRGTLPEKIKMIFKLFDPDRSNSISPKEMKLMLEKSFFSNSRKVSTDRIVRHQTVDQLVQQAFATYDKDHNNLLSEAEFTEWAMTSYDIRQLISKIGDWELLFSRPEEGISGPTSIEHLVHLDRQGNYSIKTLPPEWIELFKEAGVTKKEANNPEVVRNLVQILLDHIPSINLPGHDLSHPPDLPPRPHETEPSIDLKSSLPSYSAPPPPPPEHAAPPPPPSLPPVEPPSAPSLPVAHVSVPTPPAPPPDHGHSSAAPPALSLADQLKQRQALHHVDASAKTQPPSSSSSSSPGDLLHEIRRGTSLRHVDLTQVQLAKSTEERNDLTAVLKRALESMRFSVANTDDPNPNDPEDDDDDW